METLFQPVLSTEPQPGHKPADVLTLKEFLSLLRKEEDYYPGEQYNTRLMITRLRKIFYDVEGWNSQLIRGAAAIPNRYLVSIENCNAQNLIAGSLKKVRRYQHNEAKSKCRVVRYRKDDRECPGCPNQPEIIVNEHQDVLLPEGYHCDIGHVLAGLDAFNYPQVVSPLPSSLFFLHKLFPHVDSNGDVTTWLGDISSSSADFLFAHLNHKDTSIDALQKIIHEDAPGSDMLGNIDAFVINKCFDINTNKGYRVTEILESYYFNDDLRKERFKTFCKCVGLEWNGVTFTNESAWLQYYKTQLRDNISFYVYSRSENFWSKFLLPYKILKNRYADYLRIDLLLEIFLTALKNQLIK